MWRDAGSSRCRHAGDVRVVPGAQLPALLRGPGHLPDRELADPHRPDPAGPRHHPQRCRRRLPGRLPVRPRPAAGGLGRAGRRPQRQAPPPAHRAGRGHGAVVPARRPGLHGRPAAGRPVRRGVTRRTLHGLRQPGPAGLRRRDGPRGPRPQRRQPEQRHDDQLPRHRPGPGRPAHHHRGLRLGLLGRRPLLHRRARQPVADAHRGATPVDPGRPGQGPGAPGPALRAGHPRARRAPGDDGRGRDPLLQLPGRPPAARDPDLRPVEGHVHHPLLLHQPRVAGRRPVDGPPPVDRRDRRGQGVPWPSA